MFFLLILSLLDVGTQRKVQNSGCIELDGLTSPYYLEIKDSSRICVNIEKGAFLIKGDSITLYNLHGTQSSNAFGAGSGSYYIYSLKYPQIAKLFIVHSDDETELIINTKTNWKGAVTLYQEYENNQFKINNKQTMAFINPNKFNIKAKKIGKSLISYNNNTREDELSLDSQEFVQIGVKSSEDTQEKSSYKITSKVEIEVTGNENIFPQIMFKSLPNLFFVDGIIDMTLNDYYYDNESDTIIIIVLGIIAAILGFLIVFCIVYFLILKKPCFKAFRKLTLEDSSLTQTLL